MILLAGMKRFKSAIQSFIRVSAWFDEMIGDVRP
jgi:hypothetical protein